jgi:hypothetical protein
MMEFLAFVKEIGETNEGKPIYRFDFTVDKDVVWGEFWNISPATLVPDIEPDIKCLSKQSSVVLPYKMELASRNSCFSMQDCIDGIIALCYPDIYEPHLEKDEAPLFFRFGETYDEVVNKLKDYGIEFFSESIPDVSDKSALEELEEGITHHDEFVLNGDDEDDNDDEYDF